VPPVQETPASKPNQPTHHKAVKKKVEQDVTASPPALPPPLAGGVPPDYVPPAEVIPVAPAPLPCADCGVIANVREVAREGKGSGAGAIIGGLAGGALANNIGRGNTRTIATIAGAVGGGMLGNSIEKSQHRTVGYQIAVRLEDGTTRTIAADTMPSWRIGDKVRIVGGGIVSR
jgi:outer membrane lipoprotein SlyB